jgi:hypothetical protein
MPSHGLEPARGETTAHVSIRREAARQQDGPSQSGARKEAGSEGRRGWKQIAEDGLCVICCCVADTAQGTPAEGCEFCGGSGWALPCPGCAGMGIVIDNSERDPHRCETCHGRRVQAMLQIVERLEAS